MSGSLLYSPHFSRGARPYRDAMMKLLRGDHAWREPPPPRQVPPRRTEAQADKQGAELDIMTVDEWLALREWDV